MQGFYTLTLTTKRKKISRWSLSSHCLHWQNQSLLHDYNVIHDASSQFLSILYLWYMYYYITICTQFNKEPQIEIFLKFFLHSNFNLTHCLLPATCGKNPKFATNRIKIWGKLRIFRKISIRDFFLWNTGLLTNTTQTITPKSRACDPLFSAIIQ